MDFNEIKWIKMFLSYIHIHVSSCWMRDCTPLRSKDKYKWTYIVQRPWGAKCSYNGNLTILARMQCYTTDLFGLFGVGLNGFDTCRTVDLMVVDCSNNKKILAPWSGVCLIHEHWIWLAIIGIISQLTATYMNLMLYFLICVNKVV